jgi:hypothetical protein
MGVDIKEVIQEATFFFRFDLRKKGFIIDVKSSEKGWDVQAELLDPRPDLSNSYKKVYDQNIYLIAVDRDLKILSCEKIGTREKTGEIRFFPKEKRVHRQTPSKSPPSSKESPVERKVSLDPSLVGNLAEEISRRVSSSLRQKKESPSEEEPVIEKEAFIDPHQEVNLDFNFARVGKLEREEEENLSEAVERLKEISSKKE